MGVISFRQYEPLFKNIFPKLFANVDNSFIIFMVIVHTAIVIEPLNI